MSTYIVGDVHGNTEGLIRALHRHNLTDSDGNRTVSRDSAKIIQIGDMANCVGTSVEDDLHCLTMVMKGTIDYMLLGNHEVGYFDPANSFAGFQFDAKISRVLHEMRDRKILLPAWKYENVLVSHAGIAEGLLPPYQDSLPDVFEKSNSLWDEARYNHEWFSAVGTARYGHHSKGGILWCDFDEEFEPTMFPQIVGHTIGRVRMKDNALCIDVGSKEPDSEPFILELI
jgi:Calcineurin-like phosphoesterase